MSTFRRLVLGRVVGGVQLVDLPIVSMDENDVPSCERLPADSSIPTVPALIDGQVVEAPQSVKEAIEAEARAADLAANGTRYTLQNQFLALCDQLTGQTTHAKLGFAELQSIITGLMQAAPQTAVALSLQLLTLNSALVREGGIQWWDNCVWTEGLPQ